MRYFVLCLPDVEGVDAYVCAEVVRELTLEDEDRELSLAAALAGPRAVIATRAELASDPLGRQALEAWEARDDTEFHRESLALVDDLPERPALHAVTDADEAGRAKAPVRLPVAEAYRDALHRARGLRQSARSLVQRSQEQRSAALFQRRRLSTAIKHGEKEHA